MQKVLSLRSLGSRRSAAVIIAVIAAVSAAIAAKIAVGRLRTEHPPVSPTIPRVQELDATPAPSPEPGE